MLRAGLAGLFRQGPCYVVHMDSDTGEGFGSETLNQSGRVAEELEQGH